MVARITSGRRQVEPVTAFYDPGISGAVAVFDEGGGPWTVLDLPLMGGGKQVILNGVEMSKLFRQYGVTRAVVEQVSGGGGQSQGRRQAGMFKFGTTYGQILGVVQASGVPYELVTPNRWKRDMTLPGGPGKEEIARRRAIELFPNMAEYLTRKKDHNRAEALLLGYWFYNRRKAND